MRSFFVGGAAGKVDALVARDYHWASPTTSTGALSAKRHAVAATLTGAGGSGGLSIDVLGVGGGAPGDGGGVTGLLLTTGSKKEWATSQISTRPSPHKGELGGSPRRPAHIIDHVVQGRRPLAPERR